MTILPQEEEMPYYRSYEKQYDIFTITNHSPLGYGFGLVLVFYTFYTDNK